MADLSGSDTRVIPLARAYVYDPGQGDPVVDDHGFNWYDILRDTYAYGSSTVDSSNISKLEFIPGIGLVCRGSVVLQDTTTSVWLTDSTDGVTDNGAWETRRPPSGSPRKQRISQYKTTADITWHRASTFAAPANPNFAFTVFILDTSADHDATTYAPYVRLSFGNLGWAIAFQRGLGVFLEQRISGDYVPVMELPEPPDMITGSFEGEKLVMVRCVRGKIAVSMDRGRNWLIYGADDGSSLSIPTGVMHLTGQGNGVMFGLHQMSMVAGVYTSPTRNTFTARSVIAAPTLTARKYEPGSATVALADAGTPASMIAGYTATLTPGSAGLTPFTWYDSPELYSVWLKYAVSNHAWSGAGVNSEPFATSIMSVDISKPYDLHESNCSLVVRRFPTDTIDIERWRWRKVAIDLGHYNEDGTSSFTRAFTGYTQRPSLSWTSYGDSTMTLPLDNLAAHFKRTIWDYTQVFPLGGQSVNEALDVVLASEGLNSSYRVWHVYGDVDLPAGLAEDPFELTRPGESKWETMTRLAGYVGLELVVTDSGGFITLPYEYYDPAVSKVYNADESTTLKNAVLGAETVYDSVDSATAVQVVGTLTTGETAMAWAVDAWAEQAAAHQRFCPWREIVLEDVAGTTTAGLMAARVQGIAREKFPPKITADIQHYVDLAVGRRNQVQVTGTTEAGISGSWYFVVLTLRQRYHHTMAGCETVAGLRRLGT